VVILEPKVEDTVNAAVNATYKNRGPTMYLISPNSEQCVKDLSLETRELMFRLSRCLFQDVAAMIILCRILEKFPDGQKLSVQLGSSVSKPFFNIVHQDSL
jgi:hypothetical protein